MANGPLSLVNVHLDTRINSKDRLAQLAPVLDALDGVGTSQLIGGDFNTMDVRWVRTMWPLLYVERQTAAVRKRPGGRRVSHSVRRYAGNRQVSPSPDPVGLALFEAVDGARLRRRHGPADRPSRRVDSHGFRLTRRDADGWRGQAPQSLRSNTASASDTDLEFTVVIATHRHSMVPPEQGCLSCAFWSSAAAFAGSARRSCWRATATR